MSFLSQVPKNFNKSAPPSRNFVKAALDCVEVLYTKARWFALFDVFPNDKQLRELCLELLLQIDPKSSPGYPYIWQGVTSNQQVIDSDSLTDQVVAEFIYLMGFLRRGEQLPSPTVRLFVKPEPHKIEKIQEGRLRLIWAMPLAYQLIHRYFFGPSLAAELKNFEEIPTKVGMAWVRGGCHRIYKSLDDGSDEIADVDKRSWDLSVPAWLIWLDFECRWRLCLNPNPVWERSLRACYQSLLVSRVIFSDGTILVQDVGLPGIVRSGSMITISGNSRMQVILKVLFCFEELKGFDPVRHKLIAVGDDTLERMRGVPVAQYQDWLTRYGFKCKEISLGSMSTRVFCSHGFKQHRGIMVPVPQNWEKHCYMLTRKERKKLQFYPEQLLSMMLEYCFVDDKFKQLQSELARVQPELCYSQQMFQNLMLGLENGAQLPLIAEDTLLQLARDPLCRYLVSAVIYSKADAMPFLLRLVNVELNPGPAGFFYDSTCVPNFDEFFLMYTFAFTLVMYVNPRTRFGGMIYASFLLAILPSAEGTCFRANVYVAKTEGLKNLLFHKDSGITAPPRILDPLLRPLARAFDSDFSKTLGSIIPRDIGTFFTPSRFNEPLHDLQRETSIVMLKHNKKSKSSQRKRELGKAKRIVKTIAKTEAKAIVQAVKKTGPRQKKMKRGGGRLAFLHANRFNMDTARFGGRDLVAKIVLSAASASSTSGKDVAGTVLYSTQLRPHLMIPNVRLARLMSLFLKWRLLKARFTFKSSLPPGSNAGTMLFVHEPDPNELIPLQYAAPSAGTLSNYDSHSVKSLVPMAKQPHDFKGEFSDFLNLSPSLAKGPSGGFFMVDPENLATPVENSMGQFAIFVQDAHNILGASAFLPTQQYEIGSLFFEYEIEVQTASDNSNNAAGYSSIMCVQTLSPVTNYKQLANSIPTAAFTQSPVPANSPGNMQFSPSFYYRQGANGVPITYQYDGTHGYMGFAESGVYLVFLQITTVGNVNDFGTTASGFVLTHKTQAGSTGSVLETHTTYCNNTTGVTTGPAVSCVFDCEDPELDWLQLDWTLGTGGSATATNTNNVELHVVALPPEVVSVTRKLLRQQKAEEKALEDTRPKLEAMFAEFLRNSGIELPTQSLLSGKSEQRSDELLSRSIADLAELGETKQSQLPPDPRVALRAAGGSGWLKIREPDRGEQSAVQQPQRVSDKSERSTDGREASRVRDGDRSALVEPLPPRKQSSKA